MKSASGGCIHDSQVWEFADGERFFVKQNRESAADQLRAEYEALRVIHKTDTVRCPKPFFFEVFESHGAVLVLEFLDLQRLSGKSGAVLGRDLAALHACTSNQFGWEADNFIGSTPQKNGKKEHWVDFFWEKRIQFQLELAARNGQHFKDTGRLEKAIRKLLEDHAPSPSLLHGDLWGGNAGALPDGTPVVFDPASYYGDAEADLAFTEVFGGFPRDFYDAYRESSGLDSSGYESRKAIYNLYHYLNHLNIFGGSYYGSCESIIDSTIRRYG